jgi:hypothetical protein
MDESADEKLFVLSAMVIPVQRWNEVFAAVKAWRRQLRLRFGILVQNELHAWKFVSGRGRPSNQTIVKATRVSIFLDALALVAGMPDVMVFNAVFDKKQKYTAFDRILHRINRTMQRINGYAVVFCDEGSEVEYTRIQRKMRVYNPIYSDRGLWEDGARTKNMPIERIVEDPVFKDSAKSYFIQLVDFVAYALLRRENQIPSKNKYGLHEAFAILSPVLYRGAARYDPDGILRR